ncbi:hypothetical protein R3P38DRAFT_3107032 [Favolaschia claudopus]|uniref:Uncharacterized protein n=1 Tax=Favolaschia claudopus TaxID=2862362 RepID=A0AAV9ZIM4_9AGAR
MNLTAEHSAGDCPGSHCQTQDTAKTQTTVPVGRSDGCRGQRGSLEGKRSTETTVLPFTLEFDSLCFTTPIDAFEWPPFFACDIPSSAVSAYPSPHALPYSRPITSASSSSSFQNSSNVLTGLPDSVSHHARSLSACSTLSSIGGDLSMLTSLVAPNINSISADLLSIGDSKADSFLFPPDMSINEMAVGIINNEGIGYGPPAYLTGYMDAPQVDEDRVTGQGEVYDMEMGVGMDNATPVDRSRAYLTGPIGVNCTWPRFQIRLHLLENFKNGSPTTLLGAQNRGKRRKRKEKKRTLEN